MVIGAAIMSDLGAWWLSNEVDCDMLANCNIVNAPDTIVN